MISPFVLACSGKNGTRVYSKAALLYAAHGAGRADRLESCGTWLGSPRRLVRSLSEMLAACIVSLLSLLLYLFCVKLSGLSFTLFLVHKLAFCLMKHVLLVAMIERSSKP
jgi:hypothetical protein